ncbi:ASCH domain-containing protein [Burkholderia pseudomallei]|uniref:ASCH domain-containing protein n=1 Tax=Burkholderia pseudomallei TaxID=28450 RepID=UPI0009782910|nr:ASCH domain-containing protein [Burkholderia pseudomallei]MBO2982835.1 ASCH domain-containing protein [Burkholderia pseudomallei]MBO7785999.1 ASCH domain-containing protein [Burkholderia pseudomallei]MBO7915021.1 ASCH domain-containing protein [Burkholderia pseudomallei]MCV9981308.1 ASCH domain-containing protein [Burkholderia pseudomallei]MCV9987501.1 ASCH domain-containing protein [Burkholderia pseudomallei]
MKVLLSIKPEYADRIFDGSKKFEFRKTIFKNHSVTKVVVYATMPIGKVIGEFDVGDVIENTPRKLWQQTGTWAGISRAFFDTYFHGRTRAFAIQVINPHRYETPLDLDAIAPRCTPPQSFRYLSA